NVNVKELEDEVFGDKNGTPISKRNIFLGAYPIESDGATLLDMEYITPHKSKFKSRNPISLMKIKPNVRFIFGFILHDAEKTGVSAEELCQLFRRLVLEMGIGAKTNVGFGRMVKGKTNENTIGFKNNVLHLISGNPASNNRNASGTWKPRNNSGNTNRNRSKKDRR
ncbi:MAG: type III-B CRISPR module RAMP protein Cmr6, partial [Oscillospiraceae bacterium]|nr:type III-B CRISPR module RAMP protein Cmr6 [Oscillospiraceae bacterium]